MTKRMLVDATHPEETRVAIVESYRDHNRLEDLDFGLASKPILRGNIYLAKVMRIEPSLQAAFVEYGGNRHGFLPFSEIHPDYFRIPVADRSQEEINAEDDSAADDETGAEGEDRTPEEIAETEEYTQNPEGSEDTGEGAENRESEPKASSSAVNQNEVEEAQAPAAEEQAAPPAPVLGTFAEHAPDPDMDVGLITDFGNAAVGDIGNLTEVAMPEAPPESVGGEVTERIVRQHRPRYKIQEVLKRGQVMLIQVVKEERGNKGAALTTFLSLAGRYCVLMPNTDHGGGVSRKITNHQDRRRMKEILDQLEIPEGMAVILRTAGMEQAPPEIQRDLDYLLRLWDNIREQTLQSSAPSLIYEEANLIKRSVRDLYSQDIQEILIAGEEGYNRASDFMRAIMPDQASKIKLYSDPIPLFIRYQVENQIDTLHNPIAQLRSGGYLVINPTEALVSIDVNSGRATRERHIEETALKTNLEAADEIARQLRLRDLAGLVVIDFIDMEDGRNNAAVERRLKEAMKNDRARLQIGRISPFGLMELSRQRLRPSLMEINFEKCPHCSGLGFIRSADSAALSVLRAIEEEAIRGRASEITAYAPATVGIYILNHKRDVLSSLESRYGVKAILQNDELLPQPGYKIERSKNRSGAATVRAAAPAVNMDQILAETDRELPPFPSQEEGESDFRAEAAGNDEAQDDSNNPNRRGRRGRFRNDKSRRNRGPRQDREDRPQVPAPEGEGEQPLSNGNGAEGDEVEETNGNSGDPNDQENQRRRRRGRRGGRRRSGEEKPRGDFQRPHTPHQGQAPRQDWAPPPHPTEGAASGYAAHPAPVPQVHIPMSVHELDTTPKSLQEEKASRSYEIINPPTEAPKAGWWRRLTGQ